jgi:hypothetical protein
MGEQLLYQDKGKHFFDLGDVNVSYSDSLPQEKLHDREKTPVKVVVFRDQRPG